MLALELQPITSVNTLSAGLDYYKPTMSQLAHEQEPDAEVTFAFHDRGEQRLMDYVDLVELQSRFDLLRVRGWQESELQYLGSLRNSAGEAIFNTTYLDYLRRQSLPEVVVSYDQDRDDVMIETTGPWALSSFWETIVMSQVNETYFESYLEQHVLDPMAVYDEGDRHLSEKIAVLQANPNIKFADFGTRRHFSYRWQQHVVGRLVAECPGNLIGTSNIALAQEYGIRPIGTFAHELPMVYAGLADIRSEDIRASHGKLLDDWYVRYGNDLSVALTDTFTTEFFFSDFTPEQAEQWHGVRQDSGDPVAFGEQLINFYEQHGIDPRQKTVVFSDGLDIGQIIKLQHHFEGRINVLFGWGTTLTNDMGMKPLNVVMKAIHVRLPGIGEADTVKLSDDVGKHTGPLPQVLRYMDIFCPKPSRSYDAST